MKRLSDIQQEIRALIGRIDEGIGKNELIAELENLDAAIGENYDLIKDMSDHWGLHTDHGMAQDFDRLVG